jgi:hypothetical protein
MSLYEYYRFEKMSCKLLFETLKLSVYEVPVAIHAGRLESNNVTCGENFGLQ